MESEIPFEIGERKSAFSFGMLLFIQSLLMKNDSIWNRSTELDTENSDFSNWHDNCNNKPV